MTNNNTRPEPLHDAATDVATTQGTWMGVVTALVSAGVITASTGQLITALLGLIPGILAIVATAIGAAGTARAARPKVTPVTDPRNNDGTPLVPDLAPPAPLPEPPPADLPPPTIDPAVGRPRRSS